MDSIEEIGDRVAGASSIGRGGFAIVRGWAVDEERLEPVEEVFAALGSGTRMPAVLGLPRPDVAQHHGAAALRAGFVAVVPITAPLGEYRLSFSARFRGEDLVCNFEGSVGIVVGEPRDPLAGRHKRNERWAFAVEGVFRSDGTSLASGDANVAVVSWRTPAFIKLWAIDLARRLPAERIIARTGGIDLPVLAGLSRVDAALSAGVFSASRCGFAVPVIPPVSGVESIDLFAFDAGSDFISLGKIRIGRSDSLPYQALPQTNGIAGRIDEITIDGRTVTDPGNVSLPRGSELGIRGWAYDEIGPRRSGGVYACTEDDATFEADYGGLRADVAAAHDAPAISSCEFQIKIGAGSLSPGRHDISIVALSSRRDAKAPLGDRIVLWVTEAKAS